VLPIGCFRTSGAGASRALSAAVVHVCFLRLVLRELLRAVLLRVELRFAAVFLAILFRVEPFLATLFLPSRLAKPVSPRRSADLVLRKFARFFLGLSYFEAPASRRAMAIACLRLFTLPPRPRGSSSCLYSCITRPMVFFCALDSRCAILVLLGRIASMGSFRVPPDCFNALIAPKFTKLGVATGNTSARRRRASAIRHFA
jgi:hypothetical protein